jgi:hypothetical protein
VQTRRLPTSYRPGLPLAVTLLLTCWLPAPATGQTTCKDTHLLPPPGYPQSSPLDLDIIEVFNSRGHLIATYEITSVSEIHSNSDSEDLYKIEIDGRPYTNDIVANPSGEYDGATTDKIIAGLCPSQTGPPSSVGSANRSRVAGQRPLAPASGQAANSYCYGDFNGDGYVDTAAATGSGIRITLFGTAGTTLSTSSIPLASGRILSQIVTADFNGDGKLDLAVVYLATSPSGQGGVTVLLGKGDGTFGTPMELAAGSGPNILSLAVGDFNGDGNPDLAVGGYIESDTNFNFMLTAQLGILLGHGDGTFAPAVMASVPSMMIPKYIVSADFNGDGILDLAVLDWRTVEPNPDKVWVLPGKGDGTFGAPSGTVPGTGQGYLAYTDLNHDGNMDLVVADPLSNGMATLMGNGDGTFQTPTLYAASAQQGGVSLALIPTGDGSTAIFTPDDLTGGILLTIAGPDGTVNSPVIQPLGKGLSGIAAADVNGDGLPDLLVTDATAGNLSVLIGAGSGQFGAPATYALGSRPLAVASGDLNHDGKPDAVVADAAGLDVLLGNGSGGFGAVTKYPAAFGQLSSVVLVDFNRDGNLDAAAVNSQGLSLYMGHGDGKFGAEQMIPFSGGNVPTIAVAADLNGDGRPDLIAGFVPGSFTGTPPPGGFSVRLGAGDGTFSAPMDRLLPGSFAGGLQVADVNGDGVPDVIASSADQFLRVQIAVFLGNGDGTFQAPLLTPTGTSGGMLLVTDLDGDGKPDLIVADCNFNGGRSCGASEPSYMLGRGDGTFQPEVRFSVGPGSSALAVADFNGDGKPDLAAADHRTLGELGALTVLMNGFPPPPGATPMTAPAKRK